MSWQPIKTAPKDGTSIIVYGKFAGEIAGIIDGKHVGIASWQGGRGDYAGFTWRAENTDAYAAWWRPTHWMPLPEPPTITTPQRGREETE